MVETGLPSVGVLMFAAPSTYDITHGQRSLGRLSAVPQNWTAGWALPERQSALHPTARHWSWECRPASLCGLPM